MPVLSLFFPGKGGFQECLQLETAVPHSKSAQMVTNLSLLPTIISSAYTTSTSGRPGGVYVDVPCNILHDTVSKSVAEKIVAEVVALKIVADAQAHVSQRVGKRNGKGRGEGGRERRGKRRGE